VVLLAVEDLDEELVGLGRGAREVAQAARAGEAGRHEDPGEDQADRAEDEDAVPALGGADHAPADGDAAGLAGGVLDLDLRGAVELDEGVVLDLRLAAHIVGAEVVDVEVVLGEDEESAALAPGDVDVARRLTAPPDATVLGDRQRRAADPR